MKYQVKRLSIRFLALSTLSVLMACNSPVQEDPKAKNIIFLIGDGMGLHQVFAAYTVNHGSLAIEGVSHVGLQKTQSANKYITDSAASGTAMACGQKTNNGVIGQDTSMNEVESIIKYLEMRDLSTGLVSTSAITHATPASFIANEDSRNSYEAIADDFLKTDIDLVIGGGLDHFSKREDGRDLTIELKENGYTIATNLEELDAHTSGKIYALTAPVHNPRVSDGRDDMLPIATRKALELLGQDEDGFFVMIEGSQIDWGGHANDQEYVVTETMDFDASIKIALDFAKENGETLVVVTGDHETGGMIILNGDLENGTLETVFTSSGHTGIFIPVYAYGPGAELFTGIYENTSFKEKFIQALGLD
jgi:alkaline phosphatase